MTWQKAAYARYYNRDLGWVDGTTEFHTLCRKYVPSGGKILEIGAGPNNRTSEMLASLGDLTGIDPDPDVKTNPWLGRAEVMTSEEFPVESSAFDVCFSDYVVEHLPDPETHMREVHRVLKPGGHYLFRTPNLPHYVSVISAATPHWFHLLTANRARGLAKESHDPYPTRYRMNTRGRVLALATKAGLHIVSLDLVEKEPSYGHFSRVAFFAGVAYERLVNRFETLAPLRANLRVVLRKP